MRDNITYTQLKLEEAFNKFDILQTNIENFTILAQLELSSSIRNYIINDSKIIDGCNESDMLSLKRKELFDSIKKFQNDLIATTIQNKHSYNNDESVNVTDFALASESLLKISTNEIKEFSKRSKSSLLYDKITDYKEHLDTLNQIIQRGRKNEYTVLLMGEYQSGKTTFINSIIGKHVGAIGDGNTTSAVPIAVSYGEKPKVEILWKNKEHLVTLLQFIKKYINNFPLATFDIDNEYQRNELYNILNDFRDKNDCPKAKEPGLKILALCSLVLKYYGNIRLQNFQQSEVDINNVPNISRFPKEFESRWRKKGGNGFTFEESIFAFVEKVKCYIPSETLNQLNCTFVDSPGLFSNAYDTKITEKEMLRANAILYLLPYDKEVGEDSCGSLYILRNNYTDIIRKLFIVNNRSFCDNKKFYHTNCANICEMFGPSMNLYRTDARLAYLGAIKKSFDEGMLSKEEIEGFITSCKSEHDENDEDSLIFNNFTDAWEYCLHPYTYRYKWNQTPTADNVIEKSKFVEILNGLLTFTKNNRAYSIVVSDGIAKLYSELISIRNSLKLRYINPHTLGRKNTEDLWKKRIEQSVIFEESSKPIIHKYLFESIDNRSSLLKTLSDNVYNKLFTNDNIDRLIIYICREVYNNKWELSICGKNEEKIKKIISPKIETVVTDFITERISYWNSLIKYGQDKTFSDTFQEKIKLLEVELDKIWENNYEADLDFKSSSIRKMYYNLSNDTSTFSIGSSQHSGQDLTSGRISLMGGLLSDIASITAAILFFLMPTIIAIIISVVSNPLGFAAGGVVVMFGAGYYLCTGDDWVENIFINNQAPKIKQKIKEQGLETILKNFINQELISILKKYSSTIIIDKKKMEDDKDIAISSPSEIIESNCFEAIKEVSHIDNTLNEYDSFINHYVKKL